MTEARRQARAGSLARFVARARHAARCASTELELSRLVCTAAVDEGGFQMAWLGTVTPDGLVLPLAYAGVEAGYLPSVRVTAVDDREGRGPTGRAIRSGAHQSCQDIVTDPRMDPWREHAVQRGFRSSAAIPVRRRGEVAGALTVYCREPNAFGEEVLARLDEVAAAVSEALDRLAG